MSSFQSLWHYVIMFLLMARALQYTWNLVHNSLMPLAALSVPSAYIVCKLTLWGTPQATHVLLVAIGLVFLKGCSSVIASAHRMTALWENRMILEESNPQAAVQVYFPSPNSAAQQQQQQQQHQQRAAAAMTQRGAASSPQPAPKRGARTLPRR
eukprot:TRINITY_DN502_c0_g2_i3.p2 TRINITY_DN502_c0_g2~~TRINITY_DN502_c0_g2_i3.p2  ORF type:complete len:154 (+),score=34.08 TRINITY_DN502_c0_g2_i3:298-759(+)